jgi:VanZ family protein
MGKLVWHGKIFSGEDNLDIFNRILAYWERFSKWLPWVVPLLKRWGPVVLMMVLIFLASSIPGDRMPNAGQWDFSVKKGGHMTGYALLAVSLMHAQKKQANRAVYLALLACFLYALSDEYHQSFVFGRNATLVDVGIDMLGATLGLLVRAFLRRRRREVGKV